MKIERTTTGKRIVTTALVESENHAFNVGVGNPKFFDHPLHLYLGDDVDGRMVELRLTENEARDLLVQLTKAVERCESLRK